MNPAQRQADSEGSALSNKPAGEICWAVPFSQQIFALRTADTKLLEMAANVFRPWLSTADRSGVSHHWYIESTDARREQNFAQPASWRISCNLNTEVIEQESRERALMMVEYLSVQALPDLSDQRISLHGALVSRHGKGVLILGAGETGKSTLACALWQRGWALLSDDRTLVNLQNLTAYPTPRRISLRQPSRALLGDFLWRRILLSPSCMEAKKGLVFHPHEIDGRARLLSSDLAAIIFLARRGATASAAELKPIASATALLALLGHSNQTLQIGFGKAIKRLQPLAASVPAYDLGRGPLSEMTQKLEELLSG